MGGGKSSGSSAAEAQVQANREAQEEIRRQFDITQAQFAPFIEAGTRQLPTLESRATVGGLDAILGQIFGTTPTQAAQPAGAIPGATPPIAGPAPVFDEAAFLRDRERDRDFNILRTVDFGGFASQRNEIAEAQALEAARAAFEADAAARAPAFTPAPAPALPAQAGGEAFRALIDERQRGIQGQLAAGGLTRSGSALQEAARIPTDLGFQIEQLLTGRSQSLAGQAQAGAGAVGQFGAGASGGISSLAQASGQAISSGILADQQAAAQGASNIGTLAGAGIGGFFGGLPGAQIGAGLGGVASGIFGFSDPALKENIEKISEINGLGIYQWDWISETKDTIIEGCQTIGFMADEVEERFPQHVNEFAGFKMIDYPRLLDELDDISTKALLEHDVPLMIGVN